MSTLSLRDDRICSALGNGAILARSGGCVSSPRFVDRRNELLALEAALARTRAGLGSVVFVGGEAGIGKSRLMAELSGRAERDGMTVVVGECLPLSGGELPYAPVVGALRSLVAEREGSELEVILGSVREELSALLPELPPGRRDVASPPAGQGSQARLFEQLLGVLASAARERPLVLVVEDFQWADRSTCDFFSFLISAARHEPIALMITYRSDELRRRHPLRHCMLELERSGAAIRVELGPFTRAEVREQVAAILDEPPPAALVDRLLQRSEGNPFFTEELLASSHAPGEPLPESLRDTLLARVESQSTVVRDVLRIAAVAGRTVDHALLAAVAELSEDRLNGALREAIESYLLAPDSARAGYSFRHALLREAIYSDLLPGERRNLHLRLARALSAQALLGGGKAAAAELARHWYAAGALPEALAASVSAGVAAEDLYAVGEAWRHYERALEIWDLVAPAPGELPLERLEVLRRAADAALMAGEEERAISLAHDLLARIDEHDDSIGAALAHERLGRYLWIAGRDEDALPMYGRAVELMPHDPPSEELALVLAAEGQALMLCDRTAESNSRCEEALAIARTVGAEAVKAHVLNTMAGNLAAVGEAGRAVEAASRARTIARRLRLTDELHRSYVNGSAALHEAARIDESIAMAREGIASAREFGVERQWGDVLRAELADRLLQVGRWREAEQQIEEVIDHSPTGFSAAMAYRSVGYLRAERGEFDAAASAIKQAEAHLPRALGSMARGPVAAARASLELWAGRPESAAAIVSDCLEQVGENEHVFLTARLYEVGGRACADLAARAPGDDRTFRQQTATARGLLERLDGLIARMSGEIPPLVWASRAVCAAHASRIGGTGNAALWADARRHWDTCQDPYHAAYARWREAEALLASGGDRAVVKALLGDAHAVVDELGARPLRAELETLARRARLALGKEPPLEVAPNAAFERLELTPREIEVLALLADGLTNREIGAELYISDKTASVHVSRILTKLSVANRAAAAAAAHHLGITPAHTRSAA
ncbi:MAG TPA: AAA family ATPase [Solirubrobacteraceae bacterium]|nr:AAA family ATPase [Solirubrobacteraceae bacterium]